MSESKHTAAKELPNWMDREDRIFLAFVRDHRELGYGRMMQIISEEWQRVHGDSAMTCGPAYATMEKLRKRCATEGHDWSEGSSYMWCDRCGYGEPK